jgi:viroplasmin and RNaseH domain-containing protein
VNDTLLFLNLKQKIMTITVSNISESSSNKSRTFELAKEFAAQLIALNKGEIRITTSHPPKAISSQSKKSKERDVTHFLEELNKAKELLDLGIIDKKEFKTIKQKIINKI